MRRILVEEEQASRPELSLPTVEHEEQQTEESTTPAPVNTERKVSRSGRPLRWAILIFGSIGVFSLLVAPLTGVSLSEWLQGADFKAAYGTDNLSFIRGSAALKTGNLSAATDALMSMPTNSKAAGELAAILFGPLMEAKDYERAARIAGHLNGSGTTGASATSLGSVLGKERGLAGSLEFLAKSEEIARNRTAILPGVFTAVASTELPALEKLSATLTGDEKNSAIQTIAQAHITANHFDTAWKWSEQLPEVLQDPLRRTLINEEIKVEPKAAVKHLDALKPDASTNSLRHSLMISVMRSDLEAARQLAEKITDSSLKKSALQSIANEERQQEEWKKTLAQVDSPQFSTLKSPEEKADMLLGLLVRSAQSPSVRTHILPRLTAIAKNNPSLVKLHDDAMRYLIVINQGKELRQQYLNQMLDSATRTAFEEELNTKPTISAELKWKNGSAGASAPGYGTTSTFRAGS